MTQAACSAASEQAAKHKEMSWHLGPKAKKWAAKASKRVRAMLRDVSQALIKDKRGGECQHSWLLPFWNELEEAKPAPYVNNYKEQLCAC